MRARLTRGLLETTPRPAKGDIRVQDAEVPSLTARITSTGAVTFYAYYRINGRQRRPKIGAWPTTSIERARQIARDVASDAQAGIDLSGRRAQARAAPTVAEFMASYITDYAEPHKAPRSVISERSAIQRHINPAIGKLKLSELTPRDIARLLATTARLGGPVQANRVGALVSKALNLAEEWGVRERGTNPAARFKRQPEPRRRMALDAAAMMRLGEALGSIEAESRYHALACELVRLLVLTGARRDEILTAKAGQLDHRRRVLRVPRNKEGNPHKTIPLGATAWAICARLALGGGGWLFPSPRREDQRMGAPRAAWTAIKKAARLPADLHIHDLRHTYASSALALGYSLDQIGAVLGHADPTTTQEYAYLLDDPRRAAVTEIDGAVGRIILRKAE